MSESESKRLADFSRSVRLSSFMRLKSVLPGKENWRPVPEAMSFAELALHLLDCDNYLFDRLEGKNTPPQYGRPDTIDIRDRAQYEALLAALESSGNQRAMVIENLSDEALARSLYDARFKSDISIWWLIMRGNLDHEAHHRGQIASYLRIAGLV